MDIQYTRGDKGESWFFSLIIRKKQMVIECVYWKHQNISRGRKSYKTMAEFPEFLSVITGSNFKLVAS